MSFRPLRRSVPKTKKTLRVHARYRAYLRYGLVLTKQIAREFEMAIQEPARKGEAVASLVKHQSLTKSLYDVAYRGDTYRVAYNRKLRSLITFLPRKEGDALDL